MRFADVVGLAVSALYQQKVRTALTMLGVVIGSLVLLLSLAIGQGVREVIAAEWRRNDQLRRINVWPGRRNLEQDIPAEDLVVKGDMSDARRDRLRQALVRRWQGRPKREGDRLLTPEKLRQLAELDHVVARVPVIQWHGARVRLGDKARRVMAAAAEPGDAHYSRRVVAGDFFTPDQPHGAVVSEFLLYQLGVRDEADVPGVIGRTLRLELSSNPFRFNSMLFLLGGEASELVPADEDLLGKIVRRLPDLVGRLDLTADERERLTKLLRRPRTTPAAHPPVAFTEEFTITGVLRMPTREEAREGFNYYLDTNGDVFVPATTAEELFFRFPGNRESGINSVTLRVDSEDHVKEVDRRIEAMGLESYAPIHALERVKFNVLMVSLATSFVALVALVVAGLGIANTLLMSVLERTHEIGVMKAVGARDRHIQLLFLVEGALVGLAGSALGLLGGWLASYPLDRLARRLSEQHAQTPLTQSVVAFPWWLVLGVPLFVTLLTMLAAVYPARRAARVNPMTALRHE